MLWCYEFISNQLYKALISDEMTTAMQKKLNEWRILNVNMIMWRQYILKFDKDGLNVSST